MDRPEDYTKEMARLALAFPGEDKGARATVKALMESPEALRGAYAVVHLIAAFGSSMIHDGFDTVDALHHSTALASLIERHLGDLLSTEVVSQFKVDYERAIETL